MNKEQIEKILKEADDVLGNYSDKQNQWFHSKKHKMNGIKAALEVNNNQGKKNAESGHMSRIQKIGCSIGGNNSGKLKSKSYLKKIGLLGNEANQQKYGVRIIATNLLNEKSWEYISIREAERDLNIQAPIIRKILKGLQPKTRCGWTFEYKK